MVCNLKARGVFSIFAAASRAAAGGFLIDIRHFKPLNTFVFLLIFRQFLVYHPELLAFFAAQNCVRSRAINSPRRSSSIESNIWLSESVNVFSAMSLSAISSHIDNFSKGSGLFVPR